MLLVAYWHGLRASEVITLRPENITDKYITVQRLRGNNKTTHSLVRHSDPLLNEATALLARIAEVGTGRLFPISRNQVWRLIQKYGTAAGIPREKLHPQVLKRSLVVHGLPEAGVENMREYLGQADNSGVREYLRAHHAPGKSQRPIQQLLPMRTPWKYVPSGLRGCRKHPGAGFYTSGRQRVCKQCAREKRRRSYANRLETPRTKYSNFLNQARTRGIPVTLSFEEWQRLKASPCAYRIDDSNWPVGIDRKDNKEGYTLGNCIPCCSLHNRIKGDAFTYDQMIETVRRYQIPCGKIHTGRKRIDRR